MSSQLSVTEVAEYGFSRRHLHRLLARYREGGLDALDLQSRRPRSSPHATPPNPGQIQVSTEAGELHMPQSPGLPSTEPSPPCLEARLAEYAALRAEILARTGQQETLVTANITIAAAIAAFVIGQAHSLTGALLLIPSTSLALAGFWINHMMHISRISEYIRLELWVWKPSWEDKVADVAWRWSIGALGALLPFLVPAGAAVIFALASGPGLLEILIASGYLIAIACGLLLFERERRKARDAECAALVDGD